MNDVLIARSVVGVLAQLADRADPARLEIQEALETMVTRSPQDPGFPGYLAQIGPLIAVAAGGFRIEVQVLSTEDASLHPGAGVGDLYVYALISPSEQELELHSFG